MGTIKTNFLYQLLTSFVHAAAPLITFPYIARTLGPELLGTVNFIDYTTQIFAIIASFGIPLYGSREIARHMHDKAKINKLISELVTIHMMATLLSIVLFCIAISFSTTFDQYKLLVVCAILNLSFSAFALDWVVTGLEDFKFISIRSLIGRLISVACIFLLVKSHNDFNVYYLILVSVNAFIIIMDVIYVLRKKMGFRFTFNFKEHSSSLFIFFLTSVGLSFYALIDTFFLGVVSGTLAVGLYTTATKIIKISQNFINDLAYTLMPRMSYLIETNNINETKRVLEKSFYYVLTVSIPLTVLFYTLAPEIILLIAGSQYRDAIITLRLLSILPILNGLRGILRLQVLIPNKKEKQMMFSIFAASFVSILLCLILCPIFGADGAAIACITAELTALLMMLFFVRRIIAIKIPFLSVIGLVLSALLFIPIIYFLRSVSQNHLVIFISALPACILVYFFLQLFLFSNPILKAMITHVNSIVKRCIYTSNE